MRLEISPNHRLGNFIIDTDDESHLSRTARVKDEASDDISFIDSSKSSRTKTYNGSPMSSLDIKVPGGSKKTTPPKLKQKRMRRRRSSDSVKDYYYQNEDDFIERSSSSEDVIESAISREALKENRSRKENNSDGNWKTSSRSKLGKSSVLRKEEIPYGQWLVLISLVFGFTYYHYHEKVFGKRGKIVESPKVGQKKWRRMEKKKRKSRQKSVAKKVSSKKAVKSFDTEPTLDNKSSPDSVSTDGSSSTNEADNQDKEEHINVKQVVVNKINTDKFDDDEWATKKLDSVNDKVDEDEWTTVGAGASKRNKSADKASDIESDGQDKTPKDAEEVVSTTEKVDKVDECEWTTVPKRSKSPHKASTNSIVDDHLNNSSTVESSSCPASIEEDSAPELVDENLESVEYRVVDPVEDLNVIEISKKNEETFSEKDDEAFARMLQKQEEELAAAQFSNQSVDDADVWEEVQHRSKRRGKKAETIVS